MVQLSPQEIEYQKLHVHDDRSQDIVSSHAICITLAFLAVVLRFLSRKLGKIPIGADDWTIILAFVFGLGEVIGGLVCVRYGGGKHAILLTNPKAFAKSVIATEVLYNPAIACVKFSVLLLFRRIFPSKPFRIVLLVVGIIVFIYSWIIVFSAIFQCRPVAAAWDPTIPNPRCFKFNIMVVVFAVLNSITDVTTMCLPMPMLWRLQMPFKRKLQVMALFAAAGFVCIVSIYRIPKEAELSLMDAPWSDVDAAVWSVVEVCIGIVSACLPTYRPLVIYCMRLVTGHHPEEHDDSNYPSISKQSGVSGSMSKNGGGGGAGAGEWGRGGSASAWQRAGSSEDDRDYERGIKMDEGLSHTDFNKGNNNTTSITTTAQDGVSRGADDSRYNNPIEKERTNHEQKPKSKTLTTNTRPNNNNDGYTKPGRSVGLSTPLPPLVAYQTDRAGRMWQVREPTKHV